MNITGDVVKTGAKAGLSIVESSLLGAFSVLCLTVAVLCVILAFRAQNARVADQKAMSDKMEALVHKQADYNAKTLTALERLNDSEKQQVAILQGLQQMLSTISMSLMHRNRGG